VRDFLIEKLKSAELAIKAFMKEVADLKVQQAADKEVGNTCPRPFYFHTYDM
jgi:hypothetical protein